MWYWIVTQHGFRCVRLQTRKGNGSSPRPWLGVGKTSHLQVGRFHPMIIAAPILRNAVASHRHICRCPRLDPGRRIMRGSRPSTNLAVQRQVHDSGPMPCDPRVLFNHSLSRTSFDEIAAVPVHPPPCRDLKYTLKVLHANLSPSP